MTAKFEKVLALAAAEIVSGKDVRLPLLFKLYECEKEGADVLGRIEKMNDGKLLVRYCLAIGDKNGAEEILIILRAREDYVLRPSRMHSTLFREILQRKIAQDCLRDDPCFFLSADRISLELSGVKQKPWKNKDSAIGRFFCDLNLELTRKLVLESAQKQP